MSVAPEIIGRDEELGAVRAFISRVGDGPGALVLSGEAGIGKTILWEAGVEEARERFDRVLICHGVEAEASLSFAGLSDLLGSVLVGGRALARAAATACARGRAACWPSRARRRRIRTRSGWPCSTSCVFLPTRGPVLVALDDAQWLDPASAAVLQIALRRLSEEPVGLLATVRKAPELGEPFELERVVPGRAARADLARPAQLWPRCTACSRSDSGSS